MNKISKSKAEKGYLIRLADGQGWHMTASEEISHWVGRLASMMELGEYRSDGYPRLIFVRGKSEKAPANSMKQKDLPEQGWVGRDFGSVQLWFHPEVPDVICEIGPGSDHELDILRMWLSLDPIYQRAQESGGLPFHAALIERDGMGVLLAASGDTGKSTCCTRIPHPWQALCDDEALVVQNDQKQYLVHPFPTWSDYLWRRSRRTWNVQHCVPLKALFFLEQAEVDETIPMKESQAALYANNAAIQVSRRTWRHMGHAEVTVTRKRLFENACRLAKAVPAFILRVSIGGRFWEEMEKVLEDR